MAHYMDESVCAFARSLQALIAAGAQGFAFWCRLCPDLTILDDFKRTVDTGELVEGHLDGIITMNFLKIMQHQKRCVEMQH